MSNPCSYWDPNVSPWMDLAVVTMSFLLHDDMVVRTQFDLLNCPADFHLPETGSVTDFNSAAQLTHNLFGSVRETGDLTNEENPATEVRSCSFVYIILVSNIYK